MRKCYVITGDQVQCGHCNFLQRWDKETGCIDEPTHAKGCCGLSPVDEPENLDTDKLAKESRALFKKWVDTLTDDDVDKILGIERPEAKVKTLATKFQEYFESRPIHPLSKDMDFKALAEVAELHFSKQNEG